MRVPAPLVAASCLLSLLAGCAAPRGGVAPPGASNAELVDHLSDQAFVSADAAYRSAHYLRSEEPAPADFSELRAELVGSGVVPSRWRHDPDEALRRGEVSLLLCRACEVRTGINFQLLGLERYALRELIYRGVARAGSEWAFISGGEYLGMLHRADRLRPRAQDEPRLGAPPSGP